MARKAVQQFMLGSVLKNEASVKETLAAIKAAGYDSVELCGFMLHPMGFLVRMLTKAARMPVGSGGNLDWEQLKYWNIHRGFCPKSICKCIK